MHSAVLLTLSLLGRVQGLVLPARLYSASLPALALDTTLAEEHDVFDDSTVFAADEPHRIAIAPQLRLPRTVSHSSLDFEANSIQRRSKKEFLVATESDGSSGITSFTAQENHVLAVDTDDATNYDLALAFASADGPDLQTSHSFDFTPSLKSTSALELTPADAASVGSTSGELKIADDGADVLPTD